MTSAPTVPVAHGLPADQPATTTPDQADASDRADAPDRPDRLEESAAAATQPPAAVGTARRARPARAIKPDTTLAAAVEQAREAARLIAEAGTVGDHDGLVMEADRVGTHYFACTAAGYRGWRWAVTVTRVSRSRKVTVSETHLLPGPDAVLAPDWLPYEERITPGDLGPEDVLPFREADPLLEPGFEATGEEEVDQLALWELGLGRPRVLSAEGREDAAQRWYDSDNGPREGQPRPPESACGSCGFYLPLAGALRRTFGVCANAWSPSDGHVVSLDHGCGAHSETDVQASSPAATTAPLLDDFEVELVP